MAVSRELEMVAMAQGFLVAVLGMVVNAGSPYLRGLP
jgi:hypothetical protein